MSGMFQEILAFILNSAGWVLVSSTLPTDYWKVSSLDGTVITTATFWSNLWKTCVTDSTGVSNCKDFPSMLALDGQPCHFCPWPCLFFDPLNGLRQSFQLCFLTFSWSFYLRVHINSWISSVCSVLCWIYASMHLYFHMPCAEFLEKIQDRPHEAIKDIHD